MAGNPEKSAEHPIQVVAHRTGLSTDVLRAWERRYQAVSPLRSPTGRRLYSDQDVERLLLLRRATDAGRRISDVAALGRQELEELVARDEEAMASRGPGRPPAEGGTSPTATAFLGAARSAISLLDADALRSVLREAGVAMSRQDLLADFLVPLIEGVGADWMNGDLRVANEHLASSVLRSFLSRLTQPGTLSSGASRILVTTPAGQVHELGAMLAAASAEIAGWRATYLGPDLPSEEIAAAMKEMGIQTVALSLVYPGANPATTEELRAIRAHLGDEARILVGGRASASYSEVLEEIRAERVQNLREFMAALAS